MYHKYRRRPLFVLLPLCLVFFLNTQSADACVCYPKRTVLDNYERTSEVLIARAVSLTRVNEESADREERSHFEGIRSITMVIEQVFKGNLRVHDEIEIGQGNGINCFWTFAQDDIGKEYLLYLYPRTQEWKLWYVWGCDRSNTLARATDDLLYLNN